MIESFNWLFAIPVMFFILLAIINKSFVPIPEEKKKLRWKVFILRFLAITLLIIGLAAPYINSTTTEQKDSVVSVLFDNSNSMSIYEDQTQELLSVLNKNGEANLISVGEDYSSPIGTGLLNTLTGNDNILLVSDGNVNSGKELKDVLQFAATLNSTINILELNPKNKDAAVRIEGPKEVLSNVPAAFNIAVDSVAQDYTAIVKVDGVEVQRFSGSSTDKFPITLSFASGSHNVEASISDSNSVNNVYRKVVTALEKPRILLLTQSYTPLESLLNQVYTVDRQSTLPNNLNSYMAVVANNMPASSLNSDILTPFVSNGNGLFLVGGNSAFEYGNYDNSEIQTLLPVKVGSAVPEDISGLNLVILIDVSVSSGVSSNGQSVVDIAKAQAINIFTKLQPDDHVGVIAFNNEAHPLADLNEVQYVSYLPNRISSLQSSGGTYIETGLIASAEMLQSAIGNKQVIVISDGKTKNPDYVLSLAEGLKTNGISVHTVSVGVGTDDVEFLTSLASSGGGQYFEAGSEGKISLVLGDARGGDEGQLRISNPTHFITSGVNLTSKITGYNQVVPKISSDLIVTKGGIPILTTWRFGLGRVAVLSTDGGQAWAGELMKKPSSDLISRSVNWAIGDPRRKQSTRIYIDDGNLEENVEVYVLSSTKPSVDGISFSEIDSGVFKGELKPSSQGYFSVLNTPFAVNYPREYQRISVSPELENIVSITGGSKLSLDDVNGLISKIKTDSQITVENRYYFREFILGGAIILFLIDIYIRRKQKN